MGQNRLMERMMQAANLLDEPLPGKTLIEIVGCSAVLIENHCGIASYTKECIVVRSKTGCIQVYGSGLVLKKMSKELIRICGKIRNVELQGRG